MAEQKPYQRTRNLFDPTAKTPFKLSRSRLENFLNCPRCFYLDRRLGIEPPATPPYTLNSAVDSLLKKEFDQYRMKGKAHPLMEKHDVRAVPFAHPMMDEWRENFKGLQYHHKPTNLIITGAVDDIWADEKGALFVVDYKSTSTSAEISLDAEYRQAFKRQMEIYQWLLRRLEFKVSDMGYFVFCNADKTRNSFDAKLEFNLEIIPYEGSDAWVEPVIVQAHECLLNDQMPDYSKNCGHCQYRKISQSLEKGVLAKQNIQGDLFLR
ncbi:MAG: PD-(D/E)XK nuclease family protein [Candidatus Omnitrophota bacterium]